MSARDNLPAEGTIIEVLGEGAYRAELPNGHRCIARAERGAADLALGAKVHLAFHPYDLSRGRIVSR